MGTSNLLFKADNISLLSEGDIVLQNISFIAGENQCWAIIGESGSGKTSLGKIIAGQFPISSGNLEWNLSSSAKKVFVGQQHDFRDYFGARSYYQQRFDSNYGDEFPFVSDILKEGFHGQEKEIENVVELLKIHHILSNRLLELSNGEGKRLQIARALIQKPKVLVLDNPFIGLDKGTRRILHDLINELVGNGVFVFLISTADELPEAVTHILELKAGSIKNTYLKNEFDPAGISFQKDDDFNINTELFQEISISNDTNFDVAVDMRDVTVQLNGKTILENINWKVRRGERWAITGPNGSGKSTLLSLINADNPQAYRNVIHLFDQKRGSGESIWDIKRKIGYISPELHIYFKRDHSFTENLFIESGRRPDSLIRLRGINCADVVASGYNDQVGSTKEVTKHQERMVYHWMDVLGIKDLAKKGFYNLPLSKQRLVLLARALVKNPPLLILDEPCQGLDKEQTVKFRNVIDSICKHTDKTLLYVSHYAEDIPESVDKILELDMGRVKLNN